MTEKENKEVNLAELPMPIKMMNIQAELRAKKNRRNDFGGFNYRSAEDILEAVKPICQKYGVLLTLNDDVEYSDTWHYVKATARVYDGTEIIETSAYAREQELKKGMDSMQITGSASSYARKYALNDAKDADDQDQTLREYLEEQYFLKQSEMTTHNIDFREDERIIGWIYNTASINTQDSKKLTDHALARLIRAYERLIQGKNDRDNATKRQEKTQAETKKQEEKDYNAILNDLNKENNK